MTWKTIALGDACDVSIGRTPARANADLWGTGMAWLSIADMSQGSTITHTKEQITSAGAGRSRPVLVGTVLLSFKLSIGRVARAGIPLYTNEAIAALPVSTGVPLDEQFLLHTLESLDLSSNSNRAAMGATLNKAQLRKLQIPLPPLAEQKRIAAILDQADEIRTKRRKQLAHLDELPQSLFHEMFVKASASWDSRTLGHLSLKFSDGPFGSNLKSAHYVPTGVRVIRLQNIGVGKFVDSDRAYITPEHFGNLRKHECLPGDLVIATLGSPNLRACVIPDWLTSSLNKADCVQMRVDPSEANSTWVCALLNSPSTLSKALLLAHGQTRARISMGQLRKLAVTVPPLRMQQAFAAKVEAIQAERDRVARALGADEELFAALQYRAFRGEL